MVGNAGGTNVGWSLWRAAMASSLTGQFCDAKQAFAGPRWMRTLYWRFAGHRPVHLRSFSAQVVAACRKERPGWLVTTGIAPVEAAALAAIRALGVRTVSYLTDDPWNPNFRAPWFERALPLYDQVFSPRRSCMPDLRASGCRDVAYLPFGYDPELSFPEALEDPADQTTFSSDILFAGGADLDRVPFIATLQQSGLRVAIYGDYWERYHETRSHARGHADPSTLRKAAAGAKVGLCLVRRANRDGHVMRSFEIPATATCMLTEDTPEHREIFGEDGAAVVYFRSRDDMLDRARWLITHAQERQRLAGAGYALITSGGHTYNHRLATMLGLPDNSSGSVAS
jgi:spore maturation protein CgeB